ncbi:MAG: ABC transporter ATP-binding protein, partial [Deltaproteobacteria bacterium]|nr:ABC transporter ATP-binding protein [Deltaproteobacteria bacterium]
STTLKTISSILKPSKGTVTFNGVRLDLVPPHKIIEHGLAHVPEGRRLFPEMSVEENLVVGALKGEAKTKRSETIQWVYDLFPRLKERRVQPAGTLSGGEQQMVAIGRGLMSVPKLLMFDEPSLGLAPILVMEIFEIVDQVRSQGVTVLLVEQNVKHTLSICDRAYVLENGRITISGTGNELLNNEHVQKAYLGI